MIVDWQLLIGDCAAFVVILRFVVPREEAGA